ncbi:hypothetical protein GALMADRAFT_144826 [Galerina marginata CBS 339.88]|uniref:CHAT domain-containing protein n=1 Tax=Galerina marginata (strain CBS 339.88) TaxID=685588 RepID=A0A067SR25_GALM3|nr:hypothetical protein GALMADRAFT_144826 [Galerina marginata CBS 339.88]
MADHLEHHEGRTQSASLNPPEESSNMETPNKDSLEVASSSGVAPAKVEIGTSSSSGGETGSSTITPDEETSSIISSHSTTGAHPELSSSHSSGAPKPVNSSLTMSDRAVPRPEDMLDGLVGIFENMMSAIETHDPASAKVEIPSAVIPTYLLDTENRWGDRPAGKVAKEAFSRLTEEVKQAFNTLDTIEEAVSTARAGPGTQTSFPPSPSSSTTPPQTVDPFARLNSRLNSLFRDLGRSSLSPHSAVPAASSPTALATSRARGQNDMDMMSKIVLTNPVIVRLALQQITSHMQTLSSNEPSYTFWQSHLGLYLLHLYEITWNDKELDEGVIATTRSILAVDMNDPGEMLTHIPMLTRNWAYGQRLLVQKDGDISKLTTAIEMLNSLRNVYKDIDETVSPNRAMALWRSDLGACLFDRFRATGNLKDLDDAIEILQVVLEKGYDVSGLGLAHYERFLQSGNLDDLDRALYHSRKKFTGTDPEIPLFSSMPLANAPPGPEEIAGRHLYGLVLAQRFNMTLDTRDLDRAIESCRNALKALSPSHPMQSVFQADLAWIFLSRFEALEEPEDLRTALEMIQSAVRVFENSSGGKLGSHSRVPPQALYGYLLSIDGKMSNDPLMVGEGIRHLTTSRKMYSGPHFLESRVEYYLSQAYLIQFDLTKSISKSETLQSVIYHATLAFEKAKENSPYRFQLGLHLGSSLILSYDLSMDQTHLHEAIAHFRSVAFSSTWPSIRLKAAVRWADAADLLGGDGTIEALEVALSILPSLAWAGNSMPAQYRMLSAQQSTIANRAAIHALDAGKIAKAVSYLESGRNILWAQALQLRSSQLTSEDRRYEEQKYLSQFLSWQSHRPEDIPFIGPDLDFSRGLQRLRETGAPTELQDGMKSLGGILDTLKQRMVELSGSEIVSRDLTSTGQFKQDILEGSMDASLHNAAKRWDELRKSVEEVDEMLPLHGQNFINLNNNDLFKILQAGSIVMLNTYKDRCDAIIIRQKHGSVDLQHVPLPGISGEDAHAQAWAEGLRQGLYDLEGNEVSMTDFEDAFLVPVLRGLWNGIARPILNHLALKNERQRVWWYPTGPLAFLPIHAASPCEGDEPGLPELVVSSYIPSIHSLVRAYRSSKEPLHILAVGQPNTPGFTPLPYVHKEIQAIQKLTKDAPDSLTTMIGEDATVFKVMKSLPEHTALHFSCHADQDQSYPFNSAFFLHDGPFHLSKLMNLDLSRVQFAFLSACLTSSGDVSLPDEGIHLAAGMQFAGVRSVVATIWTVYERAASMATKHVYQHLLKDGVENAEAQNAAEALHFAIIKMKKANVPLSRRVPFIHLGL